MKTSVLLSLCLLFVTLPVTAASIFSIDAGGLGKASPVRIPDRAATAMFANVISVYSARQALTRKKSAGFLFSAVARAAWASAASVLDG